MSRPMKGDTILYASMDKTSRHFKKNEESRPPMWTQMSQLGGGGNRLLNTRTSKASRATAYITFAINVRYHITRKSRSPGPPGANIEVGINDTGQETKGRPKYKLADLHTILSTDLGKENPHARQCTTPKRVPARAIPILRMDNAANHSDVG
jgi:hypothetical protein